MTDHLTPERRAELALSIELDPVAAYNDGAGNQWGAGLAKWVPEHVRPGMVRYILFGILPGSFLSAILSGDYFEACRRADDENRRRLFDYAMFLMNYAPGGCFGSAENMAEWSRNGGLLGHGEREDQAC